MTKTCYVSFMRWNMCIILFQIRLVGFAVNICWKNNPQVDICLSTCSSPDIKPTNMWSYFLMPSAKLRCSEYQFLIEPVHLQCRATLFLRQNLTYAVRHSPYWIISAVLCERGFIADRKIVGLYIIQMSTIALWKSYMIRRKNK